ncbi:hypothetical protein ACWKWC_21325 [Geodermatophilus nigrescens]
MSGPPASPVHRCALHAGTGEAAALAVALARRALDAGCPVVAHVDDDLRRALTGRLPRGAVAFASHEALAGATPDDLVADWTRHLASTSAARVAVLCQQPFGLLPDVERWRAAEFATTAALAGRPVEVTCLVDTAAVPPADVAMARATHPVLWCDGADLPNPDLEPPPPGEDRGGRCGDTLAEGVLDPEAAAGNRAWWAEVLGAAGLADGRRDELVLVLHEAVGTAAALTGRPAAVPVRVARDGAALRCEVAVGAPCPSLRPSAVPDDRRLLMLWLAEKVSPAVTLALQPAPGGCRIVVRAEPLDGG